MAVGLALSAACIAAAFQDDVLSGSFGWRQPLGLLSAAAVAIGVLPGLTAVELRALAACPSLTLTSVLGQFPENPPEGDYRILWIGDPRVMPVPAWTLAAGDRLRDHRRRPADAVRGRGRAGRRRSRAEVGSIVTAAGLGVDVARRPAAGAVRDSLHRRAGRGRRGQHGRPAAAAAAGLVDALDDQLDFAAPLTRPLNFLVYENTAWIPTRAQFAAADADATRQAGMDSLAELELRPIATPVAVGAADNGRCQFAAQPGAVTVATGDRFPLVARRRQVNRSRRGPAFGERRATTSPPADRRPCTTTRRSLACPPADR